MAVTQKITYTKDGVPFDTIEEAYDALWTDKIEGKDGEGEVMAFCKSKGDNLSITSTELESNSIVETRVWTNDNDYTEYTNLSGISTGKSFLENNGWTITEEIS